MNERSRALADLAVCPSELSVLDPNAPVLWVKFLRRTGLPMSAKSKRGQNAATDLWVDNNCKRAFIIRSFGLPALIQRLSVAKDEVSRARVWWRESAACSEGDSVADLSQENMFVLNPFIVTKELKFVNNSLEQLSRKCKESWSDVPMLVKRTVTPKMLVGLEKARKVRHERKTAA